MIYWDLQFSVIAVILLVEKVKKYLLSMNEKRKANNKKHDKYRFFHTSLLDKIFSLIQMSISWTTGAIWILALSFSNLKTATFSALQWKGKVNAISVWSLLFHAGQKGSSECLMRIACDDLYSYQLQPRMFTVGDIGSTYWRSCSLL